MPKPRKARVTPETVARIAGIAGLDIDGARAAELAPQLQAMRDGIDAMDELDLTDIEPASLFRFTAEQPR